VGAFCLLMSMVAVLAAAASPEVRVACLDGRTAAGVWRGYDAKHGFLLTTRDGEVALAGDEVMSIRWDASPVPASLPAEDEWPLLVYLKDTGRMAARVTGGDPRHVELQTRLADRLTLPLNGLAAMRFLAHREPATLQAFDEALAARETSQDTLLVIAGEKVQSLRGATESLHVEGGSFRWRDRSVPLRADRVLGVVFAAGLLREQPPPMACTLSDGTVWCGTLEHGDERQLRLKLAAGPTVLLPVADLAELRVRNDRVLFLDELEPVAYEFEPFGVTRWPWRRNRSVSNGPLRIAEQTFERGLGVHSQSRLTYRLEGDYTRFAAAIGIDSAVRPRGHVIFRVLVDGQETFNSGPVTGSDPVRAVSVPIPGGRTLELAVDFGEELDVSDHANWAEARVMR